MKPFDYGLMVVRLIAGGVFLYAGWQKFADPNQFADSIAAYQLLPQQLIDLCALSVPPLELIIGFLLLVGWQRRVAVLSASILTGVFIAAIISAIARGLTINCGCFGAGTSAKSILALELSRDLVMEAALLWEYIRQLRVARGTWAEQEHSQP
jgi:uncharacterized membrane protein YphA (DoxX/SURF4 family)